jgi:hypothetical protein
MFLRQVALAAKSLTLLYSNCYVDRIVISAYNRYIVVRLLLGSGKDVALSTPFS